MKIKQILLVISWLSLAFASVYVPSSLTSQGQLFNSMAEIYSYLYSVIRSVCIMSGVFLLVGGVYYYSQYRKDPVYMPFTKVLTMFVCSACAIGLAFIPGVTL